MSDTPETDAVAVKNIYGVASEVEVDFARKLERERDEARGELARLAGKLDAMHEANKKLQRERDQLRADIADLLHEPPLKIPLTTTP
jgi:uncharacterized coiled-coil DUF342 family protein